MRVMGLWSGGGGSWSLGELETHAETWVSLRAAKSDLWRRAVDGAGREACVVEWSADGETFTVGAVEDGRTPCVVARECHVDLYPVERVGAGVWRLVGREPVRRLTLGPRGGVRVEWL